MSSLSSTLKARSRTGLEGNPTCPGCGAKRCSVVRPPGRCNHCDGQGNWRGRGRCKCCTNGTPKPYVWCHRHDKAFALDAEAIGCLPTSKPEYPLAPIEHRHAVYSALLDLLPLSGQHTDHLIEARGLSEETIARSQFASTPSWNGFDAVVRGLASQFDLCGVPGFFQVRERWCWRGCGYNGILIPIRDQAGRIECLQIRWLTPKNPKTKYLLVSGAPGKLPHAGTRSGAPNHFLRFDPRAKSVLVVEGILKAEIVAEWSHLVGLTCPIVACVGTGTFGEMAARVQDLLSGLRTAWTAFDWDAPGSKGYEDTAQRREKLHSQFRGVGVGAEAVEWVGFKGIDDWLLSLRGKVG